MIRGASVEALSWPPHQLSSKTVHTGKRQESSGAVWTGRWCWALVQRVRCSVCFSMRWFLCTLSPTHERKDNTLVLSRRRQKNTKFPYPHKGENNHSTLNNNIFPRPFTTHIEFSLCIPYKKMAEEMCIRIYIRRNPTFLQLLISCAVSHPHKQLFSFYPRARASQSRRGVLIRWEKQPPTHPPFLDMSLSDKHSSHTLHTVFWIIKVHLDSQKWPHQCYTASLFWTSSRSLGTRLIHHFKQPEHE